MSNKWNDLKEEIEKDMQDHPFDGYKPAFLGAMKGWAASMIQSADWIRHVTGTGENSAPHYWPNDCETCKEIKDFVDNSAVLMIGTR